MEKKDFVWQNHALFDALRTELFDSAKKICHSVTNICPYERPVSPDNQGRVSIEFVLEFGVCLHT